METTRGPLRHHPILLSELIGTDGTRRYGLRVYCDVRDQSVPLAVCRECPSCLTIDDDACHSGRVRCAPPEESVPQNVTPTGRAVHRGLVAVDQGLLVRDLVALFADRKLRLVVVTDGEGRAEGVVHESQLVREIQERVHARGAKSFGWEPIHLETASSLMLRPASIAENAPLSCALAAITSTHQRQLLVVDERGTPVGLLFDVDALHAMYGRED